MPGGVQTHNRERKAQRNQPRLTPSEARSIAQDQDRALQEAERRLRLVNAAQRPDLDPVRQTQFGTTDSPESQLYYRSRAPLTQEQKVRREEIRQRALARHQQVQVHLARFKNE